MDDPGQENFRCVLDRLLDERDWSVRQLAKQISQIDARGVSHPTISGMRRGLQPPTTRVMELIARVSGPAP